MLCPVERSETSSGEGQRPDDLANCCGQWISRRGVLAMAGALSAAAAFAEFGVDSSPAFAANAWGPTTWPVPSPVAPDPAWGQNFGANRPWPEGGGTPHQGSDFVESYGTAVFAIAAGTVTYVNDGGCGGDVWITHAGGLKSRYLHLKPPTISYGLQVTAGQQIGAVGDHNLHVGCSSVDHCHLEVTLNGVAQNGYLFLLNGGALPIPPAEMDDDMIARVVYTGALPYILFTEEWSKPLTGVTGPQVVELNKFLTYDASYYPNGKLGAAVMTPAQFAFFQTTLAAPA
jgi:murein DD-endopeptidase MepM/ murein hydrolase activator NlpD